MNSFLDKAIELAKAAGEAQLQYFRKPDLKSVTKQNDFDVVTEADKASESIIIEGIRKAFPEHVILSEESGATGAQDAEWRWVVDPLDGTTNFNSGLPLFSVSIALQHYGESVAAVVYAPYLGELFTAVRGEGARLNGHPIHVRRNSNLRTMVISTGMPYDRDSNPDNNLDNITRTCVLVRGTRRTGSAALDLSYIAAGFLDAYWELDLKLWDIAAGELIVREAGGTVRPLTGHRGYSVIAGSGEALAAISPLVK